MHSESQSERAVGSTDAPRAQALSADDFNISASGDTVECQLQAAPMESRNRIDDGAVDDLIPPPFPSFSPAALGIRRPVARRHSRQDEESEEGGALHTPSVVSLR